MPVSASCVSTYNQPLQLLVSDLNNAPFKADTDTTLISLYKMAQKSFAHVSAVIPHRHHCIVSAAFRDRG